MSDVPRRMDDDAQLIHLLGSYSETGLRAFDPEAITARAVAAGNTQRRLWWWLPTTPSHGRQLPVIVALGLLLVAVAVLVGAALNVERGPVAGGIAVASGDEIHILDAEGTNHRFLPSTGHDTFPVWSRDGTRIAYTDHLNHRGVWVVNADGTGARSITDGYRSSHPVAWSPDGRQVAFAGSHDGSGDERGLYVANADGSGVLQLVDSRDELARLAWAPDGSLISFVVLRDGATLHVVDPESREVTQVTNSLLLTEGEVAPPSWSPDSFRLLYSVAYPARVDIAVAERNPSGWIERTIVSSSAGSSVSPQWIDADRFVYLRARQQLRVAKADGSGEREIARERFSRNSAPCIAPDGSRVAIAVEEWDETQDLLIVAVDAPIAPRRIPVGSLLGGGLVCSWQALGR